MEKTAYGPGTANCACTVDYQKKTICLYPIDKKTKKQKDSKLQIIISILTTNITYSTLLFIGPLLLIQYIIYTGIEQTNWLLSIQIQNLGIILIFILVPLITVLSIIQGIAICYTQTGRKLVLPKYNHNLLHAATFGLLAKNKFIAITNELLLKNIAIIPLFKNQVLEYKLTKDYAKQIKKVKVINIWKDADTDWQAQFIFKRKPKSGELKIHYY